MACGIGRTRRLPGHVANSKQLPAIGGVHGVQLHVYDNRRRWNEQHRRAVYEWTVTRRSWRVQRSSDPAAERGANVGAAHSAGLCRNAAATGPSACAADHGEFQGYNCRQPVSGYCWFQGPPRPWNQLQSSANHTHSTTYLRISIQSYGVTSSSVIK